MLSACAVPSPARGASEPGRPSAPQAPDAVGAVAVTTLEGAPRTLRDEVGGRAALVTLWASWCEACTKEIEALNRLDEGARKRGGLVIAVNEGESAAVAADFARAQGIRYHVVVDADFGVADAVGRRRLPTTIVFDRAGRVVYSGGVLDEAALSAFRSALTSP